MRESRKARADAPSAQYARSMPRRPSSCLRRATASGTPLAAEPAPMPSGTRLSFIGLHRPASEKDFGEKLLPLVALVERAHRIDDLVLELVERAVYGHARGNAVHALVDLLSFLRKHEFGEEQRRMGPRRIPGDPDGGRLAEGRLERLPVDRRAFQLQGLHVVVVRGEEERHFAR